MTQKDKNTLFRIFTIAVLDEVEGNSNSFVSDLLRDFIIKNGLESELYKWIEIY